MTMSRAELTASAMGFELVVEMETEARPFLPPVLAHAAATGKLQLQPPVTVTADFDYGYGCCYDDCCYYGYDYYYYYDTYEYDGWYYYDYY